MSAAGWIQAAAFVAILTALTPPLGAYIAWVFRGGPEEQQDWKAYARSVLVFSAACFVALYVLLRTQGIHPFNPRDLSSGTWDVSFNTAVSFVSNTSWQFYAGETTLSFFSQMAGIAVHSFLSAAVGLATAMAVIRGFASRSGSKVGNFWWDLRRGLVFVLLPISFLAALVFASQGTIQSIDIGPVASQVPIKTLGSVGGGFFNVNSAMPFENPTALSSFLQALLIVMVPAALTATFGRMVGSRRQGWLLYAVMLTFFVASVVATSAAESQSSPALEAAGIEGANLEGKEQRFGVAGSSLYAAATTAGASGAVNAAMESFTGLGGAVPMANMMTGELIFGGIGSGLSGILMMALLSVFLAGLMVGRTPEYLGKKIGVREIKIVVIGTVAVPVLALACVALAVATDYGRESIYNPGPQGFSETLYAYVSQAMNNGSAFAGYTGYVQPNGTNAGAFGITFADLGGGLAMLFGRYIPMLAALAVAGTLAGRRIHVTGAGTLRTDTGAFGVLLGGVILLIALLNFVPALMLGPVVQGATEQLF